MKLCDICGAEGFPECLMICTLCGEHPEHIYCIQNLLDPVPHSWVCEGCKLIARASILGIDDNRKGQFSLETNSHDEQCMPRQEKGELEELKGLLNDVANLQAGSTLQVGTLSNVKDRQPSENLRRGTKTAPSTKPPASNVSQTKESEQMPSFLLPSRPEGLPQRKSSNTWLSHFGASKKAEQPTGQLRKTAKTCGSHLREVHSSTSGQATSGDENSQMHGLSNNYSRRDQRGILDLLSGQGLQGMELNLFGDVSGYMRPRYPVSNPSLFSGNHGQLQPRYSNPYYVRSSRPAKPGMQHTLLQMTNLVSSQNASIVDSIPRDVQSTPQSIPHVQNLWRGSFSVSSDGDSLRVYKGVQGHPSSKAGPNIWEAARSLPTLLELKELSRDSEKGTWPESFSLVPPNTDNIDIFFFPVDMVSYDFWYNPLVQRMIAYDSILRAESMHLYLLIFHSQLLPEGYQLWDGRHYLWAVFQTKENPLVQTATLFHFTPGASDNAEVVDMDIDMVGGADICSPPIISNDHLLPPLPQSSPPLEPVPPLPPGSPPAAGPLLQFTSNDSELLLPPLPPGSPPAEPPPPPPPH